VYRLGFGLALSVSLLSHDALATNRHIRLTLDEAAGSEPTEVQVLPEAHADFPLSVEPMSVVHGRVIRLTLDDEGTIYGRLAQEHGTARRFRASLD
jgi:hypothetical protein